MANEIRFQASEAHEVCALIDRPQDAQALLVLAHGAGAGMRHTFFEGLVPRLGARRIATFRYQFPYMERGRRRPDHHTLLEQTVRAAVASARRLGLGLPLFAGGKSMGGRMTSRAASTEPLEDVAGLVFLGFPLHPAGQPSIERAAHLTDVGLPMVFIQGTRDKLAGIALLRPVVERVGATLCVIEGGDHSFDVLKRSGRNPDDVMDEVADAVATFVT